MDKCMCMEDLRPACITVGLVEGKGTQLSPFLACLHTETSSSLQSGTRLTLEKQRG